MPLIFWIAVGTALAALLLGWLLKTRLSREQVWEELVEPRLAPNEIPTKPLRETERQHISIDSRPHSRPRGEMMNIPPAQYSWSPQDGDLRRSSRVERSVPLIVLGTDLHGETFQERTSAVEVNLHGCRYSSRHDYAPDAWVTLQLTGTEGVSSRAVRARVRSVLAPRSHSDPCQVGVELETPGNVWGLPSPPKDWQSPLGISGSSEGAAAAVPLRDLSTSLAAFLEPTPVPAERKAEVTVFPAPPSSASAAAEGSSVKDLSPTNVERLVIKAEQLLQALQDKIQSAAGQAVQASLCSQLDESVKAALARIEDGWKASLRQTEDFSAARLAEVQNLWERELAVYRSRAEEISRRLEAFASNSQQSLADSQRFLERFANETAPQLQHRFTDSLARAGADFEARAAHISDQHLAQIVQGIQLACRDERALLDQSIAEARAISPSTTAGASQEQLESMLTSFRAETFNRIEERLRELYNGFEQQLASARQRSEEVARQLETLSCETRQSRSQYEQGLAEVRSLLLGASSGVSQELLDSLLESSRTQFHDLLEWRLGEVSAHFEQLFGQAQNRVDEIARQLDRLSSEVRDQLVETKALAEHASGDLQSLQPATIEQSATRAAQDLATAAARVSDRELARLVEQKQALSREISLELEARTSEAGSLLQRAVNSTLEEFRRRVEGQIDLILAEATERLNASVTSLDAESRAACQARHRAVEAEVARVAEQSTREFRSGIKAFLYSCLVAAVSAVDQHAQTTLAGLASEPTAAPPALDATTNSSGPSEPPPARKAATASE